ncbi:MAG: hypothetical protein WDZ80_06790, partial [Candidatus Paceibacterota bacterium]
MAKYNPKILERIINKTGLAESTVRSAISRLYKEYPGLPPNSVAFLYARKKGVGYIRNLLSEEERRTLPPIKEEKHPEKVKVSISKYKRKPKKIVTFETSDPFIEGHIAEINRAYDSGCYTCVFVLARKIVENFIIDILRKEFPPTSKQNKELYYDISKKRYKDFSIVLKNLYDKRTHFGVDTHAVERLYALVKPLKKEGNDKAHSWFHLVKRKSEVENLELQT